MKLKTTRLARNLYKINKNSLSPNSCEADGITLTRILNLTESESDPQVFASNFTCWLY